MFRPPRPPCRAGSRSSRRPTGSPRAWRRAAPARATSRAMAAWTRPTSFASPSMASDRITAGTPSASAARAAASSDSARRGDHPHLVPREIGIGRQRRVLARSASSAASPLRQRRSAAPRSCRSASARFTPVRAPSAPTPPPPDRPPARPRRPALTTRAGCAAARQPPALDPAHLLADRVHRRDRRARGEQRPVQRRLVLERHPLGRRRQQRRPPAADQRHDEVVLPSAPRTAPNSAARRRQPCRVGNRVRRLHHPRCPAGRGIAVARDDHALDSGPPTAARRPRAICAAPLPAPITTVRPFGRAGRAAASAAFGSAARTAASKRRVRKAVSAGSVMPRAMCPTAGSPRATDRRARGCAGASP